MMLGQEKEKTNKEDCAEPFSLSHIISLQLTAALVAATLSSSSQPGPCPEASYRNRIMNTHKNEVRLYLKVTV